MEKSARFLRFQAVFLFLTATARSQVCLDSNNIAAIPVGATPVPIALADMEGDGDLDIIAGSLNAGTISILVNDGIGGFTSSIPYFMVINQLYGIGLGDLNGDNRPDVVAARYGAGSQEVVFRMNDGVGALGPRTALASGGDGPMHPIVVDVDLDGDQDIIVSNFLSASISLFRNSGGGAFPTVETFSTGVGPQVISAANLNGDSFVDLVTSDWWLPGTISVLINDGSGMFLSHISYPSGNGSGYNAVADFDNDGDQDIVASVHYDGGGGGQGKIIIYNNNGSGAFVQASTFLGFSQPLGVAAADFDLDGDIDIAIANAHSRTDILLNNGLGQFPERLSSGITSGSYYEVAAADISGDGRPDLASTSPSSDSVHVWYNFDCQPIQPTSSTICPVGAADFIILPESDVPATYQWQVSYSPGTWADIADGTTIYSGSQLTIAGATSVQLGVQVTGPSSVPPIRFRCMRTDVSGSLVSAVGTLNILAQCAPFGAAGSGDNAYFDGTHPDPGPSGPSTTYTFQNFVVGAGGYFGLGPNEVLNLNGGTGTLYISPGGTFVGNGVIFGNVWNAGLLIIPISQVGIINTIGGSGIVWIDIPPPPVPGEPDVIVAPAPIHVPPQTYVEVGGSGFVGIGGSPGGGGGGGGGGSASGYYVINTPTVTTQGTTAWDGKLEITGSFTQTASGILRMFIAGYAQGETYSYLEVGTTAIIDGVLQIVLEPSLFGFIPAMGQSFDLIHADGGITIPASGLTLHTLMSAQGAAALGLSLPAYESGFAADPNQLVSMSENLFSYSLVEGGTTLRVTLTHPVCAPSIDPAPQSTCPDNAVVFHANGVGSGPFTYEWQIETSVGNWATIGSNPLPLPCGGTAFATDPTSESAQIGVHPCAGVATYQIRSVVTNACGSFATNPTTLIIVDRGDMNCDCAVNGLDVSPFVLALLNPTEYPNVYSNCVLLHGDTNGDNSVNQDDIADFVNCTIMGLCP